MPTPYWTDLVPGQTYYAIRADDDAAPTKDGETRSGGGIRAYIHPSRGFYWDGEAFARGITNAILFEDRDDAETTGMNLIVANPQWTMKVSVVEIPATPEWVDTVRVRVIGRR